MAPLLMPLMVKCAATSAASGPALVAMRLVCAGADAGTEGFFSFGWKTFKRDARPLPPFEAGDSAGTAAIAFVLATASGTVVVVRARTCIEGRKSPINA